LTLRGVIYIGDRQAGKTHLALELANPDNNYVRVDSYTYTKINQGGPGGTNAQKSVYERFFEVKVHLPNGEKTIMTDWLDTSGEIWERSWQVENPDKWQDFLKYIKEAEAILLILSPYREIIDPNKPDRDAFITRQQWLRRFARWVKFFQEDCSRIEHLLLCLNKADLFCPNLPAEAEKLAYDPHIQRMNFQQRDQYVYQRYFAPLHPQIRELNTSIDNLSVRCFITTVYNRKLLELPWIYLGHYLAQ